MAVFDARDVFGALGKLWAITARGDLYSVDVTTGASTRAPRDWRDTVATSAAGQQLYTVEKIGRLYVTDLAKMQWTPIGESRRSTTCGTWWRRRCAL